jgi:multiple sugar transport system permease protein/N,N'-diacetylchitobiose transport system permease protein
MTRGGPASGTTTIAFYTYLQAFSNQRFGLGSAVAFVTVACILALCLVYMRVLNRSGGETA